MTRYTSDSEFKVLPRVQISNETPPYDMYDGVNSVISKSDYWKWFLGYSIIEHDLPVTTDPYNANVEGIQNAVKIVNGEIVPTYGPEPYESYNSITGTYDTIIPTFHYHEENGVLLPEQSLLIHEFYRYLDTLYPDNPDWRFLLTNNELNDAFTQAGTLIDYNIDNLFLEKVVKSLFGGELYQDQDIIDYETIRLKIDNLKNNSFRRKFYGSSSGYSMFSSDIYEHMSIFSVGEYHTIKPVNKADLANYKAENNYIDNWNSLYKTKMKLIDWEGATNVYLKPTTITTEVLGISLPGMLYNIYEFPPSLRSTSPLLSETNINSIIENLHKDPDQSNFLLEHISTTFEEKFTYNSTDDVILNTLTSSTINNVKTAKENYPIYKEILFIEDITKVFDIIFNSYIEEPNNPTPREEGNYSGYVEILGADQVQAKWVADQTFTLDDTDRYTFFKTETRLGEEIQVLYAYEIILNEDGSYSKDPTTNEDRGIQVFRYEENENVLYAGFEQNIRMLGFTAEYINSLLYKTFTAQYDVYSKYQFIRDNFENNYKAIEYSENLEGNFFNELLHYISTEAPEIWNLLYSKDEVILDPNYAGALFLKPSEMLKYYPSYIGLDKIHRFRNTISSANTAQFYRDTILDNYNNIQELDMYNSVLPEDEVFEADTFDVGRANTETGEKALRYTINRIIAQNDPSQVFYENNSYYKISGFKKGNLSYLITSSENTIDLPYTMSSNYLYGIGIVMEPETETEPAQKLFIIGKLNPVYGEFNGKEEHLSGSFDMQIIPDEKSLDQIRALYSEDSLIGKHWEFYDNHGIEKDGIIEYYMPDPTDITDQRFKENIQMQGLLAMTDNSLPGIELVEKYKQCLDIVTNNSSLILPEIYKLLDDSLDNIVIERSKLNELNLGLPYGNGTEYYEGFSCIIHNEQQFFQCIEDNIGVQEFNASQLHLWEEINATIGANTITFTPSVFYNYFKLVMERVDFINTGIRNMSSYLEKVKPNRTHIFDYDNKNKTTIEVPLSSGNKTTEILSFGTNSEIDAFIELRPQVYADPETDESTFSLQYSYIRFLRKGKIETCLFGSMSVIPIVEGDTFTTNFDSGSIDSYLETKSRLWEKANLEEVLVFYKDIKEKFFIDNRTNFNTQMTCAGSVEFLQNFIHPETLASIDSSVNTDYKILVTMDPEQDPYTIYFNNDESKYRATTLSIGDSVFGTGILENTYITELYDTSAVLSRPYSQTGDFLLTFSLKTNYLPVNLENNFIDYQTRLLENGLYNNLTPFNLSTYGKREWPNTSKAFFSGLIDPLFFEPYSNGGSFNTVMGVVHGHLLTDDTMLVPSTLKYKNDLFIELNATKLFIEDSNKYIMRHEWLDYIENNLKDLSRATDNTNVGVQVNIETDMSGLFTFVTGQEFTDPNIELLAQTFDWEGSTVPAYAVIGTGGESRRSTWFQNIDTVKYPIVYGRAMYDDVVLNLETIAQELELSGGNYPDRTMYSDSEEAIDREVDKIGSPNNEYSDDLNERRRKETCEVPLFEIPLGEYNIQLGYTNDLLADKLTTVQASFYKQNITNVSKSFLNDEGLTIYTDNYIRQDCLQTVSSNKFISLDDTQLSTEMNENGLQFLYLGEWVPQREYNQETGRFEINYPSNIEVAFLQYQQTKTISYYTINKGVTFTDVWDQYSLDTIDGALTAEDQLFSCFDNSVLCFEIHNSEPRWVNKKLVFAGLYGSDFGYEISNKTTDNRISFVREESSIAPLGDDGISFLDCVSIKITDSLGTYNTNGAFLTDFYKNYTIRHLYDELYNGNTYDGYTIPTQKDKIYYVIFVPPVIENKKENEDEITLNEANSWNSLSMTFDGGTMFGLYPDEDGLHFVELNAKTNFMATVPFEDLKGLASSEVNAIYNPIALDLDLSDDFVSSGISPIQFMNSINTIVDLPRKNILAGSYDINLILKPGFLHLGYLYNDYISDPLSAQEITFDITTSALIKDDLNGVFYTDSYRVYIDENLQTVYGTELERFVIKFEEQKYFKNVLYTIGNYSVINTQQENFSTTTQTANVAAISGYNSDLGLMSVQDRILEIEEIKLRPAYDATKESKLFNTATEVSGFLLGITDDQKIRVSPELFADSIEQTVANNDFITNNKNLMPIRKYSSTTVEWPVDNISWTEKNYKIQDVVWNNTTLGDKLLKVPEVTSLSIITPFDEDRTVATGISSSQTSFKFYKNLLVFEGRLYENAPSVIASSGHEEFETALSMLQSGDIIEDIVLLNADLETYKEILIVTDEQGVTLSIKNAVHKNNKLVVSTETDIWYNDNIPSLKGLSTVTVTRQQLPNDLVGYSIEDLVIDSETGAINFNAVDNASTPPVYSIQSISKLGTDPIPMFNVLQPGMTQPVETDIIVGYIDVPSKSDTAELSGEEKVNLLGKDISLVNFAVDGSTEISDYKSDAFVEDILATQHYKAKDTDQIFITGNTLFAKTQTKTVDETGNYTGSLTTNPHWKKATIPMYKDYSSIELEAMPNSELYSFAVKQREALIPLFSVTPTLPVYTELVKAITDTTVQTEEQFIVENNAITVKGWKEELVGTELVIYYGNSNEFTISLDNYLGTDEEKKSSAYNEYLKLYILRFLLSGLTTTIYSEQIKDLQFTDSNILIIGDSNSITTIDKSFLSSADDIANADNWNEPNIPSYLTKMVSSENVTTTQKINIVANKDTTNIEAFEAETGYNPYEDSDGNTLPTNMFNMQIFGNIYQENLYNINSTYRDDNIMLLLGYHNSKNNIIVEESEIDLYHNGRGTLKLKQENEVPLILYSTNNGKTFNELYVHELQDFVHNVGNEADKTSYEVKIAIKLEKGLYLPIQKRNSTTEDSIIGYVLIPFETGNYVTEILDQATTGVRAEPTLGDLDNTLYSGEPKVVESEEGTLIVDNATSILKYFAVGALALSENNNVIRSINENGITLNGNIKNIDLTSSNYYRVLLAIKTKNQIENHSDYLNKKYISDYTNGNNIKVSLSTVVSDYLEADMMYSFRETLDSDSKIESTIVETSLKDTFLPGLDITEKTIFFNIPDDTILEEFEIASSFVEGIYMPNSFSLQSTLNKITITFFDKYYSEITPFSKNEITIYENGKLVTDSITISDFSETNIVLPSVNGAFNTMSAYNYFSDFVVERKLLINDNYVKGGYPALEEDLNNYYYIYDEATVNGTKVFTPKNLFNKDNKPLLFCDEFGTSILYNKEAEVLAEKFEPIYSFIKGGSIPIITEFAVEPRYFSIEDVSLDPANSSTDISINSIINNGKEKFAMTINQSLENPYIDIKVNELYSQDLSSYLFKAVKEVIIGDPGKKPEEVLEPLKVQLPERTVLEVEKPIQDFDTVTPPTFIAKPNKVDLLDEVGPFERRQNLPANKEQHTKVPFIYSIPEVIKEYEPERVDEPLKMGLPFVSIPQRTVFLGSPKPEPIKTEQYLSEVLQVSYIPKPEMPELHYINDSLGMLLYSFDDLIEKITVDSNGDYILSVPKVEVDSSNQVVELEETVSISNIEFFSKTFDYIAYKETFIDALKDPKLKDDAYTIIENVIHTFNEEKLAFDTWRKDSLYYSKNFNDYYNYFKYKTQKNWFDINYCTENELNAFDGKQYLFKVLDGNTRYNNDIVFISVDDYTQHPLFTKINNVQLLTQQDLSKNVYYTKVKHIQILDDLDKTQKEILSSEQEYHFEPCLLTLEEIKAAENIDLYSALVIDSQNLPEGFTRVYNQEDPDTVETELLLQDYLNQGKIVYSTTGFINTMHSEKAKLTIEEYKEFLEYSQQQSDYFTDIELATAIRHYSDYLNLEQKDFLQKMRDEYYYIEYSELKPSHKPTLYWNLNNNKEPIIYRLGATDYETQGTYKGTFRIVKIDLPDLSSAQSLEIKINSNVISSVNKTEPGISIEDILTGNTNNYYYSLSPIDNSALSLVISQDSLFITAGTYAEFVVDGIESQSLLTNLPYTEPLNYLRYVINDKFSSLVNSDYTQIGEDSEIENLYSALRSYLSENYAYSVYLLKKAFYDNISIIEPENDLDILENYENNRAKYISLQNILDYNDTDDVETIWQELQSTYTAFENPNTNSPYNIMYSGKMLEIEREYYTINHFIADLENLENLKYVVVKDYNENGGAIFQVTSNSDNGYTFIKSFFTLDYTIENNILMNNISYTLGIAYEEPQMAVEVGAISQLKDAFTKNMDFTYENYLYLFSGNTIKDRLTNLNLYFNLKLQYLEYLAKKALFETNYKEYLLKYVTTEETTPEVIYENYSKKFAAKEKIESLLEQYENEEKYLFSDIAIGDNLSIDEMLNTFQPLIDSNRNSSRVVSQKIRPNLEENPIQYYWAELEKSYYIPEIPISITFENTLNYKTFDDLQENDRVSYSSLVENNLLNEDFSGKYIDLPVDSYLKVNSYFQEEIEIDGKDTTIVSTKVRYFKKISESGFSGLTEIYEFEKNKDYITNDIVVNNETIYKALRDLNQNEFSIIFSDKEYLTVRLTQYDTIDNSVIFEEDYTLKYLSVDNKSSISFVPATNNINSSYAIPINIDNTWALDYLDLNSIVRWEKISSTSTTREISSVNFRSDSAEFLSISFNDFFTVVDSLSGNTTVYQKTSDHVSSCLKIETWKADFEYKIGDLVIIYISQLDSYDIYKSLFNGTQNMFLVTDNCVASIIDINETNVKEIEKLLYTIATKNETYINYLIECYYELNKADSTVNSYLLELDGFDIDTLRNPSLIALNIERYMTLYYDFYVSKFQQYLYSFAFGLYLSNYYVHSSSNSINQLQMYDIEVVQYGVYQKLSQLYNSNYKLYLDLITSDVNISKVILDIYNSLDLYYKEKSSYYYSELLTRVVNEINLLETTYVTRYASWESYREQYTNYTNFLTKYEEFQNKLNIYNAFVNYNLYIVSYIEFLEKEALYLTYLEDLRSYNTEIKTNNLLHYKIDAAILDQVYQKLISINGEFGSLKNQELPEHLYPQNWNERELGTIYDEWDENDSAQTNSKNAYINHWVKILFNEAEDENGNIPYVDPSTNENIGKLIGIKKEYHEGIAIQVDEDPENIEFEIYTDIDYVYEKQYLVFYINDTFQESTYLTKTTFADKMEYLGTAGEDEASLSFVPRLSFAQEFVYDNYYECYLFNTRRLVSGEILASYTTNQIPVQTTDTIFDITTIDGKETIISKDGSSISSIYIHPQGYGSSQDNLDTSWQTILPWEIDPDAFEEKILYNVDGNPVYLCDSSGNPILSPRGTQIVKTDEEIEILPETLSDVYTTTNVSLDRDLYIPIFKSPNFEDRLYAVTPTDTLMLPPLKESLINGYVEYDAISTEYSMEVGFVICAKGSSANNDSLNVNYSPSQVKFEYMSAYVSQWTDCSSQFRYDSAERFIVYTPKTINNESSLSLRFADLNTKLKMTIDGEIELVWNVQANSLQQIWVQSASPQIFLQQQNMAKNLSYNNYIELGVAGYGDGNFSLISDNQIIITEDSPPNVSASGKFGIHELSRDALADYVNTIQQRTAVYSINYVYNKFYDTIPTIEITFENKRELVLYCPIINMEDPFFVINKSQLADSNISTPIQYYLDCGFGRVDASSIKIKNIVDNKEYDLELYSDNELGKPGTSTFIVPYEESFELGTLISKVPYGDYQVICTYNTFYDAVSYEDKVMSNDVIITSKNIFTISEFMTGSTIETDKFVIQHNETDPIILTTKLFQKESMLFNVYGYVFMQKPAYKNMLDLHNSQSKLIEPVESRFQYKKDEIDFIKLLYSYSRLNPITISKINSINGFTLTNVLDFLDLGVEESKTLQFKILPHSYSKTLVPEFMNNSKHYVEISYLESKDFGYDRVWFNPNGYSLPPVLHRNVVYRSENNTDYSHILLKNKQNENIYECNEQGKYITYQLDTFGTLQQNILGTETGDLSATVNQLVDNRHQPYTPLYESCIDWFESKFYFESDPKNLFWQVVNFTSEYNSLLQMYEQAAELKQYKKVGSNIDLVTVPYDERYTSIKPKVDIVVDNSTVLIKSGQYLDLINGQLVFSMFQPADFYKSNSSFVNTGILVSNPFFDEKAAVFLNNTKVNSVLQCNYSVNSTENLINNLDKDSSIVEITELAILDKDRYLIMYALFPKIQYRSDTQHLSFNVLVHEDSLLDPKTIS